jgi:hypothetical protein
MRSGLSSSSSPSEVGLCLGPSNGAGSQFKNSACLGGGEMRDKSHLSSHLSRNSRPVPERLTCLATRWLYRDNFMFRNISNVWQTLFHGSQSQSPSPDNGQTRIVPTVSWIGWPCAICCSFSFTVLNSRRVLWASLGHRCRRGKLDLN